MGTRGGGSPSVKLVRTAEQRGQSRKRVRRASPALQKRGDAPAVRACLDGGGVGVDRCGVRAQGCARVKTVRGSNREWQRTNITACHRARTRTPRRALRNYEYNRAIVAASCAFADLERQRLRQNHGLRTFSIKTSPTSEICGYVGGHPSNGPARPCGIRHAQRPTRYARMRGCSVHLFDRVDEVGARVCRGDAKARARRDDGRGRVADHDDRQPALVALAAKRAVEGHASALLSTVTAALAPVLALLPASTRGTHEILAGL